MSGVVGQDLKIMRVGVAVSADGRTGVLPRALSFLQLLYEPIIEEARKIRHEVSEDIALCFNHAKFLTIAIYLKKSCSHELYLLQANIVLAEP